MPYTKIPAAATAAGASASAHLAHALHKNRLYLDHFRQCITALQSTSSGGHRHTTGSNSYSYNFTDRVRIVSGFNDRIDFYFGGGSVAAAVCAASLTAGTYSIASLVSHAQAQMRSAASATTDISVTYDSTEGSATRGLILARHTGTTDSPNARILKLLGATGANGPTGANRSALPSMGFAAKDRIGALGYAGDSGFHDGYQIDAFTLGDGGLVGASGLQSNCATTAKFAADVVQTSHLATGAVGTSNVRDGTLTGVKFGAPVNLLLGNIASTASLTSSSLTFPNHTAGNPPCVRAYATGATGAVEGDLTITAITNVGGSDWQITVQNNSVNTINVHITGF